MVVYIYLSKILPMLVLPVGLTLCLLIFALLLMWRRKRKSSAFFFLTALLVLSASSMQFVADNLMGRLEAQYPPALVSEIPQRECAVLLGGAVEAVSNPRINIELLEAADRVYQTARLYKAGKYKRVIVAGGNQPWSKIEQSEARAIRLLLLDWGVPATAIVLETESRNTRENAVNAWHLLEETNCVRPLLITSAFHMQRSVKSFAKLGIDVFPVSTDIRVIHSSKYTVVDFIPNANALKMTNDAIHEWMGQRVYQWRGWN